MGLRFRKRVKICNGLTLNFGKTGASVTVGSGCLKKTFHTNGNVTTTASLPGTGIYWTETQRSGASQPRQTAARRSRAPSGQRSQPAAEAAFLTSEPSAAAPRQEPAQGGTWSPAELRGIYAFCDPPVEWTELISGAAAEDLMMDPEQYAYCRKIAPKILSGDVNAYLDAIETLQPVNDLLLYSGDFEFGTDTPGCMEVEFTARPGDTVSRTGDGDDLRQFLCAVSIRVARDLLALLPVSSVLVHTELDGRTVLSVLFVRNEMARINFNIESIRAVMDHFEHRIAPMTGSAQSVERLEIRPR